MSEDSIQGLESGVHRAKRDMVVGQCSSGDEVVD